LSFPELACSLFPGDLAGTLPKPWCCAYKLRFPVYDFMLSTPSWLGFNRTTCGPVLAVFWGDWGRPADRPGVRAGSPRPSPARPVASGGRGAASEAPPGPAPSWALGMKISPRWKQKRTWGAPGGGDPQNSSVWGALAAPRTLSGHGPLTAGAPRAGPAVVARRAAEGSKMSALCLSSVGGSSFA